jgi:hypothetical protein
VLFSADVTTDDLCNPSPCGFNTECKDGICTCLTEFVGDPYIGCRPECIQSSDCPFNKACIKRKCQDPCPGVCAYNAECIVIKHTPMCSCASGTTGNAFLSCVEYNSK